MPEQVFSQGRKGARIRPFCLSAGVQCRGYSLPLQRALVDFGADEAFAPAAQKIQEHYGIEVPPSSVRRLVEKHGQALLEAQSLETVLPDKPGVAQLIGQLDGSLIPLVETGASKPETRGDRRKDKQLLWHEARLCLAHRPGSVTPFFAATLETVDEAGDQLLHCAIQAGAGYQTRLHCLGDGASWVCDQCQRVFGTQADFLVDFYHLCDYLSAAAQRCAPSHPKAWLTRQKEHLKEDRLDAVLVELQTHLEEKGVADSEAGVRACYRYLINRPGQFNYQQALEAGLPIGSGEIESAHRYVIQQRLKIAGAWWTHQNATYLLALRVLRANQLWDNYWKELAQKAA